MCVCDLKMNLVTFVEMIIFELLLTTFQKICLSLKSDNFNQVQNGVNLAQKLALCFGPDTMEMQ
jgi:hypothetical protein